MTDKMTTPEKLTLFLLFAGQVLSIFLWYAGPVLEKTISEWMPWIQLSFGIVASVALDLEVVVTTTGRRDGRRSIWSWLAVLAAATFSALIALSVAGGPSAGPYLHVGYALNIFLFAQHTAVPMKSTFLRSEPPKRSVVLEWFEQLGLRRAPRIDRPPTGSDPVSVPPLRLVTLSSPDSGNQGEETGFECPRCKKPLPNVHTQSAAKRLGHCSPKGECDARLEHRTDP